jgi:hypothetical protein
VRVDDRAEHDAAFLGTSVARAAVQGGDLVPHHDVADAPGVVVDEAILRRVIAELLDQSHRCIVSHPLEAMRVGRVDEQDRASRHRVLLHRAVAALRARFRAPVHGGDVGDLRALRMAVLLENVRLRAAEASPEGRQLGGGEPLAAKHQHGMVGERTLDPLERRPVERPRQIDPHDLRPQSRAERTQRATRRAPRPPGARAATSRSG